MTEDEIAALKQERSTLQKICARRADALEAVGLHADATIEEAKAASATSEELRKALYELLYVSFPPVGTDAPQLVAKHHEAVRTGCRLLGIDPGGLLGRASVVPNGERQ